MTRATVVRYTTRPDAASENERLIQDVFAALDDARPNGLRYVVARLEDGVSFVHVALTEGEDNPLIELSAFRTFTSEIAARCVDGPNPVTGDLIASYL